MAESKGTPSSPNLHNIKEFDKAARVVLEFLKKNYDLGLWMVTRTVANDWVILNSISDKYDVKDGDVLRWSDSFCYSMVHGKGPNIAPVSDEVETYANAPIGKQVPIKAYVGYPLYNRDGSLFGTLCAIDPEPLPPGMEINDEFFKNIAESLSSIMNGDKAKYDLKNLKAELETGQMDPETGLISPKAWDSILATQKEKKKKFGDPVTVIEVALEDESQDMEQAAEVLKQFDSDHTALGRLDDTHLAVMVEPEARLTPTAMAERIKDKLEQAAVTAAIGWAGLGPDQES